MKSFIQWFFDIFFLVFAIVMGWWLAENVVLKMPIYAQIAVGVISGLLFIGLLVREIRN